MVFSDLYPADVQSPRRQQYSDGPLSGIEVVRILERELYCVAIAAGDIADGGELSRGDAARLSRTSLRLLEVINDVTS